MTGEQLLALALASGWKKAYVPGSRAHYFLHKDGVSVEVECLEGSDPYSYLSGWAAYLSAVEPEDIPLLLTLDVLELCKLLLSARAQWGIPEAALLKDLLAQMLRG